VRLKRTLGLVFWLWISLSAGLPGSRFPPGDWYATLAKPSWTPPSAVFPVAWTLLYVLMGLAAWRVWRVTDRQSGMAPLGLFVLQLFLNAAWSWLFFGRHEMGAAVFEIVLLWGVILATFMAFRRHDRLAAQLLVPYLAWVGFATALNFALWKLNT